MKHKKHIYILSCLLLVFSCLFSINVLQNKWLYPLIVLALALLASWAILTIEKTTERNCYYDRVNYDCLDIARYICSVVIIIMHLRPFLDINTPLDLMFNNIISRICVPLFFMITGYFAGQKQKERPDYIKKYIRSMIPLYLLWSLLYLPLGIDYIVQLNLPIYLYPVALIVSLLYVGTYYHLWYFPALFLSLFILDKWKKYFSLSLLLKISFILLCLGATESYYGLLPDHFQSMLSTYYFNIFYTTRNFLFFGLFYVVLGYLIGQRKNNSIHHSFLKCLLALLLLIAEVFFLQTIKRLDSNILFACIPLVYYLFITLIHLDPVFSKRNPFRQWNKYYYLLHPMVIYCLQLGFLKGLHRAFFPSHPFIQIAVVLFCTHILTLLIIEIKKHFPKLPL